MTNLQLRDTTANGRARAAALDPSHRPDVTPASTVEFLSHGRVLIVGEESGALYAAQQLGDGLVATVCIPGNSRPAADTVDDLMITRGGRPQLSGSLGNFRLSFGDSSDDSDSAGVAKLEEARFDLVLDLNKSPLLQREVLPPGYYAPGRDAHALEDAIAELPDMRGEFEKPRYFNFNPNICAHGRRGVTGCTRCLDVCPTVAIKSDGRSVKVDANLCQGFGSCASVCPTGAITYAYPGPADLLAYLRAIAISYREHGGADPVFVFYDSSSAGTLADELAADMPENALPVELEEVGSVGIDTWFTCFAYGARRVLVLAGPDTPGSVLEALEHQIDVTAHILEGMGNAGGAVALLRTGGDETVTEAVSSDEAIKSRRPATFARPQEGGLFAGRRPVRANPCRQVGVHDVHELRCSLPDICAARGPGAAATEFLGMVLHTVRTVRNGLSRRRHQDRSALPLRRQGAQRAAPAARRATDVLYLLWQAFCHPVDTQGHDEKARGPLDVPDRGRPPTSRNVRNLPGQGHDARAGPGRFRDGVRSVPSWRTGQLPPRGGPKCLIATLISRLTSNYFTFKGILYHWKPAPY